MSLPLWRWGEFFQPAEILSPAGMAQLDRGNLLIQSFWMATLCSIRRAVDKPFLVNHAGLSYRGYRSPEENKRIPGAAIFSRHVQGIACDVTVKGWTASEFATFLKEHGNYFGIGFVGIYEKNNFCHIDCGARNGGLLFKKFN